MSSRYVRRLVETWLQPLATKFYPTVSQEQDPADPIWLTVEYGQVFSEKLDFCQTWQETGTITLVWLSRPGAGDDAVLSAAEVDIATFMSNTDPTGRLVLLSHTPPESFGLDSAPWFGVAIEVSYSFT